MKQKLGIGVAILTRPNFLILDESTHGLNPDGINLVYIMNFNSSDYRTTFILVNQEQFD